MARRKRRAIEERRGEGGASATRRVPQVVTSASPFLQWPAGAPCDLQEGRPSERPALEAVARRPGGPPCGHRGGL